MPKIALSQARQSSDKPNADKQAVVVMGVAGSGKSTIAQALAKTLGWQFIEGDDFHSASNHAKMQAGIALTDADRASWLAALGEQLARNAYTGVLLSCSDLKLVYPAQLRKYVQELLFSRLALLRDIAAARGEASCA